MLDKIKNIVINNPNLIAYQINNDSITYKELLDKANYYSEYIKSYNNVIIYGDKSINYFITILACLIAKRTYIPINKNTPINRIKKIISITDAELIITDDKLDIDDIYICSLNNIEKKLKLNIDNNIAYIINTSGSTGIPKSVPISYDNLDNFIDWISTLYPLNTYKNKMVLNQAHFSFDLSVADTFYSLSNGHTLISINDINNYKEVFKVIKEINIAFITPTFMKLLLVNPDFNNSNYSNLECIYFCGELLDINTVKKLFSRFPDIKIINAYGPSEATSAVSAIIITESMLDSKILPVGDMFNNACKIEIINNEIVLKGKSVFNGYLGNIIGGFYKENNINCFKTGDIGYIENNLLYCMGRSDNQIKYKGYRIELSEIEYYLNSIKEVDNSCCIAIKDNDIVKSIKAFVEVNNSISDIEMKEKLNKLLPSYMIPKTIVILDKLPINKNGKIDRMILNDRY